jgi:methylamine dehydrogenase accessory protein MauD
MQGWYVASYALLWALVIVLTLVVVGLARRLGEVGGPASSPRREEGPPLGEVALPFHQRDLAGRDVLIGGGGRAQLLLFVAPGCGGCDDALRGLEGAPSAGLKPYVLSDADDAATTVAFAAIAPAAAVVAAPEIAKAYDVPGTPYAVVVDPAGIVRVKGRAPTAAAVRELIDQARVRLAEPGAYRKVI